MKFKFVWVGKTRDANWKALQDEYLKRLSRYVLIQIAETREAPRGSNADIEGKFLLDSLDSKGYVVLLDIKGKHLSSHELAKQLERWQNRGIKELAFVIGGAEGVSSVVAERADYRLSLSFLTFTHEMARVVLLEQLYRAYTILKGFPYQK